MTQGTEVVDRERTAREHPARAALAGGALAADVDELVRALRAAFELELGDLAERRGNPLYAAEYDAQRRGVATCLRALERIAGDVAP